MIRASFIVVAAATTIVVGVGCDEEHKACYPGDYLGCACAGGAHGYAACSPAGDFAGVACVCDGTTPGVDGGSVVDATLDEAGVDDACRLEDGGAIEPGSKAYAEPCTTSAECASCRCETFGGQGVCTTTCTTVDDCPAPAVACTNRGACRPSS